LITTITLFTIVQLSLKLQSGSFINSGFKALNSSYNFHSLVCIAELATDTILHQSCKYLYASKICFTSCDFEKGGFIIIFGTFIIVSLLRKSQQSIIYFLSHFLLSLILINSSILFGSNSNINISLQFVLSISLTISHNQALGSKTSSHCLMSANSIKYLATSFGVG